MQLKLSSLAILASRLDLPGGIERAVANTANLFDSKGHKVSLIILDETSQSFYPLNPSINVIQQQLSFGITKDGNIFTRKMRMLSDVLKLRKLLRSLNPDVIISTEYPFTVATVLAGAVKSSKVFSWEHHHHAWLEKNKFWNTLFNNACKKLNGIICLNKEEANYYQKFCPVHVIPNFIARNTAKTSNTDTKQILTVGWLIPRKGIDLLLPAAKSILGIHPEWTWKIIGDGVMKQQVLDFIQKEKLHNRLIVQQPVNSTIHHEYLSSSLFVLTSRFEAFPMVLLEAMSFGLPCISFDCPSGPSDIITDNIDGILIEKENVTKLTNAISILLLNEEKRKKMGELASINISRFSPEEVYKIWKHKVLTL
jgi:glycosyltransferase involved in cell wall biosynthesis